jgi:hypothetical protein
LDSTDWAQAGGAVKLSEVCTCQSNIMQHQVAPENIKAQQHPYHPQQQLPGLAHIGSAFSRQILSGLLNLFPLPAFLLLKQHGGSAAIH